MKKTYSMPSIQKQTLSLGSGVSSSCEAIATFAEMVCAVVIDIGFEITIFQDPVICEYTGPDVNDMVCYHAPADNNNVFTS